MEEDSKYCNDDDIRMMSFHGEGRGNQLWPCYHHCVVLFARTAIVITESRKHFSYVKGSDPRFSFHYQHENVRSDSFMFHILPHEQVHQVYKILRLSDFSIPSSEWRCI